MIVDAKEMYCGGCGGDQFRIYQIKDGLASECQKCMSISLIVVTKPRIDIQWPPNAGGSAGLLCVRER